jgi:DNA-directed RNA polymerase specialized sigma24 family protein
VHGTHDFDEEQVRRLLTGGPAQIEQAVALIDLHLRNRFCASLRKRFPGMAPDDLADAWADTLLGVFLAARDRRFDGQRPLLPWLWTIASRQAIDHTRRATSREQLRAAVAEALRQTQTGRRWRSWSEAERNEVMRLIREAFTLLSYRQQVVFHVFVYHYPESGRMEVLRREVSELTKGPETVAGVKRALQECRQKVRAFLRAKGYTPDEGETT